jgi:hypothetical protein
MQLNAQIFHNENKTKWYYNATTDEGDIIFESRKKGYRTRKKMIEALGFAMANIKLLWEKYSISTH